jgi:CO/xanthine dehydrogenase Mo-binding subunit
MPPSPQPTHGWIGTSPARVDGAAKVAGTARYVADLDIPGAIESAVVRSELARARILGVERDSAFDWSDVVVVTAADVPANQVASIEYDQPVLAAAEVRHAYEPIALLACADRRKLEAARRHLRVHLEALPAVLTLEQSLRAETVIAGTDNVTKRYRVKLGDAPGAIERAEVVVRGTYRVGHQEHVYIETQGCVAWWDERGVHVVGSIQCPFYVHKALAHAFALPTEQVDVAQAVTGGAFGGKEDYPSLMAVHAALLARAAGRPVRMIYERKEDIEATTKRHPARVEVTTGCDRDGTLRAVQMNVVMDQGAYATMTPVVLSRGTLHACGAYRWEHVLVEACAVATNTPSNGAFRGFGAPQTIFAIERHMDAVAARLGLDPLELRKKNLLAVGSTMPTGQVLDGSVGVAECVRLAETASEYAAKRARLGQRRSIEGGRKARGVGASVFLHGAGFTGSGEQRLKGAVAVDLVGRGRLRVRSSSTEMGQGTETVFRQIAAEAAGVPFADVEVETPRTSRVPDSGPTVASRTVMIVGSVVDAAAREVGERVRAEMRASGAGFLAAADALLAREGKVSATRHYEPPPGASFDDKTYTGTAYGAYAWSCDVAEVEVDLDTFEIGVAGFWSATDVGRAIHPVMCEGQIEGGTLQAIGWALLEQVHWKDGLILNPRLTTYIVPTMRDAPPFFTSLVEDPYPRGPGGAKGIGELPMDGGAAAIAAAVEHATGLRFDSLPITPERLYEAWVERSGKEVV